MEHWMLDEGRSAVQRASAAWMCSVASDVFPQDALAQLRLATDAGSWSAYRLWNDRPPVLYLSAALADPQCTRRCFDSYRDDGIYAADRSFEPALRSGRPMVLRLGAQDLAAGHRQAIYDANGMVDRVSVARRQADGSVLAINAYRHADRGAFDQGAVAVFAQLASTLLAAVARQIDWLARAPAAPPDHRARLRAQQPALTERELDVLERLLEGLTYDGIAADLGLTVATVKTYRARAFDRLGIHFRNELFARCLQAAPPSS